MHPNHKAQIATVTLHEIPVLPILRNLASQVRSINGFEGLGMTPFTVKLPIIAHLGMTTCVSGKMALSQAPALRNSSARHYVAIFQKENERYTVTIAEAFRRQTRFPSDLIISMLNDQVIVLQDTLFSVLDSAMF